MGGRTILRNFRWAVAAILFLFYSRVSVADLTSTLFVGKAQIDIVVGNNGVSLPVEEVIRWVDAAAQAVGVYYGTFPVSYLSVHIIAFHGSGVRGGMTFGAERGGRIIIRVGDQTSEADFKSDWT